VARFHDAIVSFRACLRSIIVIGGTILTFVAKAEAVWPQFTDSGRLDMETPLLCPNFVHIGWDFAKVKPKLQARNQNGAKVERVPEGRIRCHHR
jgi:hypothetical protein